MRSRECPQRRIKREDGKVEWVVGMFFLLLLGILLCAQLEISIYQTAAGFMEDALAASNLASAVIDLEEYGMSHTVTIADMDAAYAGYCLALKGNLGLNDEWEGKEGGLIAGKVVVQEYIVYNVQGDMVTVSRVSANGSHSSYQGGRGAVRSPDGQVIENTSVYSAITFPVEGLFGIKAQAQKGKLVDIVAESGEEINSDAKK